MSAPRRSWPAAIIPAEPNPPTWCTTCEIHRATALRPVCPVCLDSVERAKREAQ